MKRLSLTRQQLANLMTQSYNDGRNGVYEEAFIHSIQKKIDEIVGRKVKYE